MYKNAAESGRPITSSETRHIERLQEQQGDVLAAKKEAAKSITDDDERLRLKEYITLILNREKRQQYEAGIVLTEQMQTVINDILPSIINGRPALFVGETGGAKTALAEFISRFYFQKEPEFISGYGDVNSYQLMGKTGLVKGETAFESGPIIRAMEEGKLLILDEMNAMPADFLKRINKVLQLRPGDTFTIQEDSGREVKIQPGFAIIATANEKSRRYKGVEDLSTELLNRFGANVKRIHYPDNDVVYGGMPLENLIIARASVTDRRGQLSPFINLEELENFVKACHISQQVFTGNYGEGFKDLLSPEHIADKRPGLEEQVLAPRTMTGILEKLVSFHGNKNLNDLLIDYIDGIKSQNDKSQMITILSGQGFIKPSPDSTQSV